MDHYNNDILKFINYLNNERTNIKEILKSLEILEYHLKNRTYSLTTYMHPLIEIFTREEYSSILRYNYQEIIAKKRKEYNSKLAMVESLLNKLDKNEALDEYIKTNEFISLLRKSNLSTEEQARVIYQINCINIPIIEKVIAKKESLRSNINTVKEELTSLIEKAINTYNNITSTLDIDFLNNDRIGITIKSLLDSLLEEVEFARYTLTSNIELSKMAHISEANDLLNEFIDNIKLILNNLYELTSKLPNYNKQQEEQYSENKIIYLTDENNIPFINCKNKDVIELINELKEGLISNSNETRYIEGIDSIKDSVYIKTKRNEDNPSVSFIKVDNFIIVITVDKLENMYKETTRICTKYSSKISSIKEQINNLPLPLLHESDIVEESIMSKNGKRGK